MKNLEMIEIEQDLPFTTRLKHTIKQALYWEHLFSSVHSLIKFDVICKFSNYGIKTVINTIDVNRKYDEP